MAALRTQGTRLSAAPPAAEVPSAAETRPRTGLVLLQSRAAAEEVALAVEGVLAGAPELARLAAGGPESLPRDLGRFAETVRRRSDGIDSLQRERVRLRKEMMEVVVPRTLLYLTLGTTVALGALTFAFLWPDLRPYVFPAAALILMGIVYYAVRRSQALGRAQDRIRQALEPVEIALETKRRERSRLPALLASAGYASDALEQAIAEASGEGPLVDPERPLVVPWAVARPHLSYLAGLAKARLVFVVSEEAQEGPFEHHLRLDLD